MILNARGKVLEFPRRPLIMGIVNINPDSFSGDGTLDTDQAIRLANEQVLAGADMIDVGGESARTNRSSIPAQEEIDRVLPFIERFKEVYSDLNPADSQQIFPPLLSTNTWRPQVAESALQAGAHFLNDMSALPTDENARIACHFNAALLIMHCVGEPKQKHTHVRYDNVLDTLEDFFQRKMELATNAGLSAESIVLDPGIDFAKQMGDTLRIYHQLKRLTRFGRPILLPVSRKTVIKDVLKIEDPSERDAGTIACVIAGTLRGASIFRVHNVKAVYQVLRAIHPALC
jgi:dihydropteroate synthase